MERAKRDALTFLNISGVIDELGRIKLLPIAESATRPNSKELREIKGSEYSAKLHYGRDEAIEQAVFVSEVPKCGTDRVIALRYKMFWVSLPKMKGVHLFQLLKKGKVLFEKSFKTFPDVSNVRVKETKDKMMIVWDSPSRKAINYFVSLRLSSRKAIPVGLITGSKQASFRAAGLPNGATAKAQVTASDGAITATAFSKEFSIAPSAPLAIIISPRPGSRFEAHESFSLMGNCYDAFGDQVSFKDNSVGWLINKEHFISDDESHKALDVLKTGTNTISLSSKKWGVLSEVRIHINPANRSYLLHKELLRRVQAYRNGI